MTRGDTYRIQSEFHIQAESKEAARVEFKKLADAGQLFNEEWKLISPDGDVVEVSERRKSDD